MKVSVHTAQYRLDTSWVPARMGVHEAPRLLHMQVHTHIGLPLHLCVPWARPKYAHCTRSTALPWGHQAYAQVPANKIAGPSLRVHAGVEEMLFQSVIYPSTRSSLGSLQLKAAFLAPD